MICMICTYRVQKREMPMICTFKVWKTEATFWRNLLNWSLLLQFFDMFHPILLRLPNFFQLRTFLPGRCLYEITKKWEYVFGPFWVHLDGNNMRSNDGPACKYELPSWNIAQHEVLSYRVVKHVLLCEGFIEGETNTKVCHLSRRVTFPEYEAVASNPPVALQDTGTCHLAFCEGDHRAGQEVTFHRSVWSPYYGVHSTCMPQYPIYAAHRSTALP